MALSWWELGFCGPVASGGGPESGRASVCTGFGVVTVRVGGEAGFGASAGGAAAPAGAAGGGRDWTALWQAGGNSAAFPFRQGNKSRMVGAIHEQCAVKSFIVQACRTALS